MTPHFAEEHMKSRLSILLLLTVFHVPAQKAAAVDPAGRGELPGRGTAAVALRGAPALAASGARLEVTVTPPGTTRATKGTAEIFGFPIAPVSDRAAVEWRVSGAKVTGRVDDADGAQLGTFEGTLTKTGVSGKFTYRDGRVGLWSWMGKRPRETVTSDE
jgi:hypothetical protein